MTWSPEADALTCEHCDHRLEVPRAEGTIVENPLGEAATAERGYGREVRVVHCRNCSANVTFEEQTTSSHCLFCGSPQVLAQSANRNALRPGSLIPLEVGRDAVREHFKKWTRGLWFRPNALKKVDRFDAAGLYVPYWTFDANVHSSWSADAGHYYWVTQTVPVMVNGKLQMRTQRVRKVRWVPAWGERDDSYDDLLVHASKGLTRDLAERLGSYDTTQLVPYRPEYLAGWHAEEYQIDLEEGWDTGQEKIEAAQRVLCAQDIPGDTYRNLRVQNHLSDVHWKHVLLPMWSVTYKFAGKTYPVLVHGQNGHVYGKAPLSWVKIGLLFVFVAVAIAIIALVAG